MGIYVMFYQCFGYFIYQMWCVVWLVVDIGIYYDGWMWQQVIDYFIDNIVLFDCEIVNEVDCYISWLGQVLFYEIGYLKIFELCCKVEQVLGDKFDVCVFYDIVLQLGLVLLFVLEQCIECFIVDGGFELDFGCDGYDGDVKY